MAQVYPVLDPASVALAGVTRKLEKLESAQLSLVANSVCSCGHWPVLPDEYYDTRREYTTVQKKSVVGSYCRLTA